MSDTWRDVVLMADPPIAAIAAGDDLDPLVDATGVVPVDDRKADARGDWRHLRGPVLARLVSANEALPDGVEVVLVEGYRSPALQARYFGGHVAELGAAYPDRDPVELHRLASRYVSPPELAPHSAGAAVDVVLRVDGAEVDMGCPINASPEESDHRCYTGHPGLDPQARRWRDVLGRALSGAGFVNYPTEWWHWSYGDRYWAHATGRSAARFATVHR